MSATSWDAADATAANRMNTGDKYLDSGKLYVAKFNADGIGNWIELSMSNPTIAAATNYKFADNADVAMNSRLAADAVGATRMISKANIADPSKYLSHWPAHVQPRW